MGKSTHNDAALRKKLRAYWTQRLPVTCSRCPQLVQPWDDWHLDHTTPVAMGGKDTDTWPAHALCNMTGGYVPHPTDTAAPTTAPGVPDTTGLRATAIEHDDGTLYMVRYHLSDTTRYHHWHASDHDRAPHDHPWGNTTTVLTGRLAEHTPTGVTILNPGDMVHRNAHDPHRIELLTPDAWTLFHTGTPSRKWGYHTDQGWVAHDQYPHTGRVIPVPVGGTPTRRGVGGTTPITPGVAGSSGAHTTSGGDRKSVV